MNPEKKKIVIESKSLLKIFGNNPKKILKKHDGRIDEEYLRKTGHVIGVNGVSFKVSEGEMLVVMGLSGSGKSTLIRCISGLTEVTAGDIFINGKSLPNMKEKDLIKLRRHKMGMVFQNFALLPHKTVLENIAFPLQVKGVKNADCFKQAKKMIELVSLHGKENSFPRELSGGQQQRVGIARSLAVEPDIWFLDEPFSALDPLIRLEMQDEFLRLQSMLNKTVVFITHDFNEALRLADRIAIMYHGKIEQISTPAEIVLNPATEYVRKFTKEVPREKILTVNDMKDELTEGLALSDFSISSDEIIENVAESVLSSSKPVGVVDKQGYLVGQLNPKRILHILFGEHTKPLK